MKVKAAADAKAAAAAAAERELVVMREMAVLKVRMWRNRRRTEAAQAAERVRTVAAQAAERERTEAMISELRMQNMATGVRAAELFDAYQQLCNALAATHYDAAANADAMRAEIVCEIDSIRTECLNSLVGAAAENAAKREQLKKEMEAKVANAVTIVSGDLESEVLMLEEAINELTNALQTETAARKEAVTTLEHAMDGDEQSRWEGDEACNEAIASLAAALKNEIAQRAAQGEALKKKTAESRSVAEEAAAKIRNLSHRKGELTKILNNLAADVADTEVALAAEAALRRANAFKSEAGDMMLGMQMAEPTAIDEEADTEYESDGDDFWDMI